MLGANFLYHMYSELVSVVHKSNQGRKLLFFFTRIMTAAVPKVEEEHCAAADRAIFDELQALEQQRAQGHWPHEDVAVRMFQTRTGDFIRVLDRHEAPLSPGMVSFVDACWRMRLLRVCAAVYRVLNGSGCCEYCCGRVHNLLADVSFVSLFVYL